MFAILAAISDNGDSEQFTYPIQMNVYDDPMDTEATTAATTQYLNSYMEKNMPPHLRGRWDLVPGGKPGLILLRSLVPGPAGTAMLVYTLLLEATKYLPDNFPPIKATGAVMGAGIIRLLYYVPGVGHVSASDVPLGPDRAPGIISSSGPDLDGFIPTYNL